MTDTEITTIRYRYPGEDWVEIDGDDYEIDYKTDGQCKNVTYYVRFSYFAAGQTGGCIKDENGNCRIYQSVTGRKAIVHNVQTDSPELLLPPPFWWDESEHGTWAEKQSGCYIFWRESDNSIYKKYASTSPSSSSGAIPGTISYKILRGDGKGDNCKTCIFKVFKQGEIVHEETRKECPQVELLDDKCPENTCKVDCGTHYCCYGSDGIAVSSFEK